MSEWQDITTAPMDGTPVLLSEPYKDDHYVYSGHYSRFMRSGYWKCITCEGKPDMFPTHWQPLPEPPKQN